MNRTLLAFSTLLFAASSFARENPVWPMPSPFPQPPEGVTPTTFPVPRLDWVVRVEGNNDKASKAASVIQLIFDGDSITDGWQGAGKAIWAERYAKLGAFDFGISGDRTEHVLWRISQGQLEGLHPTLVAIMIGTNNMGANSVEQIADGVKAIVKEYRARCPDATILLQAIFPRGHLATDPARAKIRETNKIIAGLADGIKVIYLDFGDKFLDAEGTLSPDVMPDFLHPNAKGYQIWADAIQPVIDRFFTQSR